MKFRCYSFIAGMGLAENSSVVLVASMLVSPLMVSGNSCFFISHVGKNNFSLFVLPIDGR